MSGYYFSTLSNLTLDPSATYHPSTTMLACNQNGVVNTYEINRDDGRRDTQALLIEGYQIDPNTNSYSYNLNSDPPKDWKGWVIAIIVIVAVILLGIALYFLLRGKKPVQGTLKRKSHGYSQKYDSKGNPVFMTVSELKKYGTMSRR